MSLSDCIRWIGLGKLDRTTLPMKLTIRFHLANLLNCSLNIYLVPPCLQILGKPLSRDSSLLANIPLQSSRSSIEVAKVRKLLLLSRVSKEPARCKSPSATHFQSHQEAQYFTTPANSTFLPNPRTIWFRSFRGTWQSSSIVPRINANSKLSMDGLYHLCMTAYHSSTHQTHSFFLSSELTSLVVLESPQACFNARGGDKKFIQILVIQLLPTVPIAPLLNSFDRS